MRRDAGEAKAGRGPCAGVRALVVGLTREEGAGRGGLTANDLRKPPPGPPRRRRGA